MIETDPIMLAAQAQADPLQGVDMLYALALVFAMMALIVWRLTWEGKP